MTDERLTEHFFLSEFVRSETAGRLAIDNTPPAHVVENLRANAQKMEVVRGILLVPVHVLSGFRSERLERAICEKDYLAWCNANRYFPGDNSWKVYFARKKHPLGLATDFVAPAFGDPAKICRRLAETDLPFHQLIFEHTWVHISWPGPGAIPPRREILTLGAGRYLPGIVEATS